MSDVTDVPANTGEPVVDPPKNRSDGPDVKTVCCHTMDLETMKACNMKILTAPCDRVLENCAVDGCTTDEYGYRACDCQTNGSFYWSMIVAVFGLVFGVVYWPPRTTDEVQPFHKALAICGYFGMFQFVIYYMMRASSPVRANQLDLHTCLGPHDPTNFIETNRLRRGKK
jgi:hypothetical protein